MGVQLAPSQGGESSPADPPGLKPGALGISFAATADVRRRKLVRKAKTLGEKVVVGRLRAIQVLTKNTNPAISRKAKADVHYIAGSFVGKRKVPYGEGFGGTN